MILHAIAFDFDCELNFSKALIQFGDFEFVFHNGGEKRVDVIETLLNDRKEKEKFAQTAIYFCLSIASMYRPCSFTYVTEFIIGGIRSDVNVFEKEPAIRIPRRSNSVTIDITNISNLKTKEQTSCNFNV